MEKGRYRRRSGFRPAVPGMQNADLLLRECPFSTQHHLHRMGSGIPHRDGGRTADHQRGTNRPASIRIPFRLWERPGALLPDPQQRKRILRSHPALRLRVEPKPGNGLPRTQAAAGTAAGTPFAADPRRALRTGRRPGRTFRPDRRGGDLRPGVPFPRRDGQLGRSAGRTEIYRSGDVRPQRNGRAGRLQIPAGDVFAGGAFQHGQSGRIRIFHCRVQFHHQDLYPGPVYRRERIPLSFGRRRGFSHRPRRPLRAAGHCPARDVRGSGRRASGRKGPREIHPPRARTVCLFAGDRPVFHERVLPQRPVCAGFLGRGLPLHRGCGLGGRHGRHYGPGRYGGREDLLGVDRPVPTVPLHGGVVRERCRIGHYADRTERKRDRKDRPDQRPGRPGPGPAQPAHHRPAAGDDLRHRRVFPRRPYPPRNDRNQDDRRGRPLSAIPAGGCRLFTQLECRPFADRFLARGADPPGTGSGTDKAVDALARAGKRTGGPNGLLPVCAL